MSLFPKKKILAIDDEPPVLQLLSKYLGGHGYEVATAATAEQARGMADGMPFQLIILDLVLPDTEGFDLLESLRSTHPEVPILVLSGIGFNEEILQEAQERGAAGYLAKAMPLSELLVEIHRILKHWRNDQ